MTTNPTKKTRHMTGEPRSSAVPTKPMSSSRLDQLEQLLTCDGGASIAEMVEKTGWQQHSVRGAMAGALKKRGLTVSSDKVDGVRRYRAERSA